MAFSKTKREIIHKKFKGHCAYCGDPIAYGDMQIDHIVPKANYKIWIEEKRNIPKFLKHLTVDDMNHNDNLNPSCRVCNKFKDTLHLELFRQELGKQLERTYKSSASYRRLLKYGLVQKTPHKIVFFFEKKRRYVYDGEHHLLQFNSEEPRWFLSWVIMRRNFRKSESNVRDLIKDINYWRDKTYELEKLVKDLRKSKNIKSSEGVTETERRNKMVDDFNRKNNKGRNYRPKKKKRRRR